MTDEKRYIANLIFENRLFRASGQEFQDFFTRIMQRYDSSFKVVKPYGKMGDRKNDGFIPNKGIFYQVYSPEDIQKGNTIKKAEKKVREDFEGLYKFWNDGCPIKQFFFVVNDRMRGIPPQLLNALFLLGQQYPSVSFDFLTSAGLREILLGMDDSDVEMIMGSIPSLKVSEITAQDLSETISFLLNAEVDLSTIDKYVVPDFDEKIRFNGLSGEIKVILDCGSINEGLLQEFFNENPTAKLRLQLCMKVLYKEVVEEIPSDEDDYGSKRFFSLVMKCFKDSKVSQSELSCVYTIISYYFSCCDIFDEPPIRGGEERLK